MRIELQDVTVERGGRRILDGVDLVFEPGLTTAVLGPTGAGLTTLLKTAAGLIEPGGGRVLHDGRALADLDAGGRRALQVRTGFVFQDAALWANSTLLTNLDLPLQAKFPHLDAATRRDRIDSVLNSWGWTADLNTRPATLPLGQQKVMSCLRALVPDPEALFLDEPTAFLDRSGRRTLARILEDRRRRGTTLVLAGHDLGPARQTADRLVVLHQGRVLAAGPRDRLLASDDPRVVDVVRDRIGTTERTGD